MFHNVFDNSLCVCFNFCLQDTKSTQVKSGRGIVWNHIRQPENLWEGWGNRLRKKEEIQTDSTVGPSAGNITKISLSPGFSNYLFMFQCTEKEHRGNVSRPAFQGTSSGQKGSIRFCSEKQGPDSHEGSLVSLFPWVGKGFDEEEKKNIPKYP